MRFDKEDVYFLGKVFFPISGVVTRVSAPLGFGSPTAGCRRKTLPRMV